LLKKKHDHLVSEPESFVVDEDGEKDFVLVSKVGSTSESVAEGSMPQSTSDTTITQSSAVATTAIEQDADGDIQMTDGGEAGLSTGAITATKSGKAPPLPPRPKTQEASGSDMMFGNLTHQQSIKRSAYNLLQVSSMMLPNVWTTACSKSKRRC
jgi:hypothetical protein